jgi:hypothetical protein
MNWVMSTFFAVVVWLVLSFVGLLLPIFLGLVFFLFLASIISGYIAGLGKRVQSILIVSFLTTVLAGIVGFETIGSAPETRNVTGIGWTSDSLIFVWIILNLLLTLAAGYLKFRLGKES